MPAINKLKNFTTNQKQCNRTLLFVLFTLSVCLGSCLSKYDTTGIVDAPVVSSDQKYLVAVIAESEAFSHQENGGFIQTSYSTSYWLKQYEIASGKLLKKKKLVASSEKNNIMPTCYGANDNTIWLYVNGLQAYDINTLEEVMNEEKLAAVSNINKNIFPLESRLIDASVENGYIDFTSYNGEQYRLLLKGFKIITKEEVVVDDEAIEKKISRSFGNNDNYGSRCDTFQHTMYALSKDSTQAAAYNPANDDLHEVTYRMKLFNAAYTTSRSGNHNSIDFYNFIQQGDSTYLNPAFAKDHYSGKVIHLSQPDGYLIIHQDKVGSNSKAILTRISTTNKKIWETATSISTRIAHCIMAGKYCIISSNESYMFSPHIGKDAVCIVDTETGHYIRPALKE